MTTSVIRRLCEMPEEFCRRNVSMFALWREIAPELPVPIEEAQIETYLRAHPDLADKWIGHSDDQRCTPAWYLKQPVASESAWGVGYYDHDPTRQIPPRAFPDVFAACAYFIARYAERLDTL